MGAQTFHDLEVSLTVIRCQAQMMQRRLASAPDNDTMVAPLDAITPMVIRLNDTIDTLSIADQEELRLLSNLAEANRCQTFD